MIETMQTNKREDQADYVAEQKIYSPERGQVGVQKIEILYIHNIVGNKK